MGTLTFETCVSDHHKLIGTMLRSTFAKSKPKKILYRCYKNFDNETFEEELKNRLSSVLDFKSFHLAFKTTLDRFAPLQKMQKIGPITNNSEIIVQIFFLLSRSLKKVLLAQSKNYLQIKHQS